MAENSDIGEKDAVRLTAIIAPAFYGVHREVKAQERTHFWLPGGRGSGKSSFVSVELLLCLMRDAQNGVCSHALAVRRFSSTLRESAFAQLLWAAQALGVRRLWEATLSPTPKLTYLPTGQSVMLRGLDDPAKIKSLKTEQGGIRYLWVEEASELEGSDKLRSLLQSVMRGLGRFTAFYSFNPPREASSWINREERLAALREDSMVCRSDYRAMPREWLGERFLAEAEHLHCVAEDRYRHEYLGEMVKNGCEVFPNAVLRKISDEELRAFDKIRRGIDWGYAADPFAYNACHYDAGHRRLYIFFELHLYRASNRETARLVGREARGGRITCDSAEPKSIDEMRAFGLRVRGAKKGPDSISYGIKWLSDLEEIVIDPNRCPESAREFTSYSLEVDREGRLLSRYPDHDNHHIDAVRYACEEDMKRRGVRF